LPHDGVNGIEKEKSKKLQSFERQSKKFLIVKYNLLEKFDAATVEK